MDLADLKTFEAVARNESMNKAASELNTVQSNVTARIRAMEDELGVALFRRHARGVAATPAAQRLLPFVARLEKLMTEAQAAARDEGVPNGVLQIGSLETTAALRLSPQLVGFAKRYPDVRLIVRTGTTSNLLRDVIECRLDGALVTAPIAHPEVRQEVMFKEELVLVTSADVRSPKELVRMIDLRTVVFQFGCAYRQRLETYLMGMGIVTAAPLEFGSLDAILGCVAAGVGVTLMPRALVENAAREKRVGMHRLPEDQALAETLFIQREDSYASSALVAFMAMMHEAARGKRRAETKFPK